MAAGGPRRASRDGIGSGARPGAARGKPRASRAKCRTYPGSRRFRRREICQVFFWPTACSALRLLAALRGCLSGPLLSHPAPSPPSTQARLPRHLTHPDPSPPSPAPSSPTRLPPRPPGPLAAGQKKGRPSRDAPFFHRRDARPPGRGPGGMAASDAALLFATGACPGRGVGCQRSRSRLSRPRSRLSQPRSLPSRPRSRLASGRGVGCLAAVRSRPSGRAG